MTEVINNIIEDKANIKNQIGGYGDTIPTLKQFSNGVKVRRLFTKQFVLDPADSFVLGSPTLGVLGTSKLGDRRVEVESFVYPFRNTVEEDLLDTQFIDMEESSFEFL